MFCSYLGLGGGPFFALAGEVSGKGEGEGEGDGVGRGVGRGDEGGSDGASEGGDNERERGVVTEGDLGDREADDRY